MEPNPYEAPKQPLDPRSGASERNAAGWLPCPQCKSADVERPSFTWWGGALGPRLLSHVRCKSCGHTYNGKTGQSNTGAIVIYSIVVGVIVLALLWVLRM